MLFTLLRVLTPINERSWTHCRLACARNNKSGSTRPVGDALAFEFSAWKKVVTSLFPTNNARLNLLLLFAQPDNELFLARLVLLFCQSSIYTQVVVKRTHRHDINLAHFGYQSWWCRFLFLQLLEILGKYAREIIKFKSFQDKPAA